MKLCPWCGGQTCPGSSGYGCVRGGVMYTQNGGETMAENETTIMDLLAKIEGTATEAVRVAEGIEIGVGPTGAAKDEKSNPSVLPTLHRVYARTSHLLGVLRAIDKTVRDDPKNAASEGPPRAFRGDRGI